MRKLIIDVDRVYADVLLNIITQYKHPSAKNRIFPLEIATRLCTISSVKYYRSWEDIMERVSKLEVE